MSYKYPFNQKIKLPNPRELTPEQIVEIRNRWLSYPERYKILNSHNGDLDDQQNPNSVEN